MSIAVEFCKQISSLASTAKYHGFREMDYGSKIGEICEPTPPSLLCNRAARDAGRRVLQARSLHGARGMS
jgi:hypothetical protein